MVYLEHWQTLLSLCLTRVGSRRVVQISAGFMIFFSTLGKFGAVFASIPFPIFDALYCVLFELVASVGISFLQFTNLNSMRNLMITGLSIFLGISVPKYFLDTMNSGHGPVNTREQLEVMEIFPGFSLYRGLYELAQYSLRVEFLGAPHLSWKDINNDKQEIADIDTTSLNEKLKILIVIALRL